MGGGEEVPCNNLCCWDIALGADACLVLSIKQLIFLELLYPEDWVHELRSINTEKGDNVFYYKLLLRREILCLH